MYSHSTSAPLTWALRERSTPCCGIWQQKSISLMTARGRPECSRPRTSTDLLGNFICRIACTYMGQMWGSHERRCVRLHGERKHAGKIKLIATDTENTRLTSVRHTELFVCSTPTRVHPCRFTLRIHAKSCFSPSSWIGSHCSAPVDILLKAGFFITRRSGTTRLDAAKISHVLANPARFGT